MNLLSLDTSTKKTGWALFQDGKYKKSGVIAFDDKDTMTRLMNMHYELEVLIEYRHIDMVVIEMTSNAEAFNNVAWNGLRYML